MTSQGLVTQNYASGSLTVAPAGTGAQGPAGPQGRPGTNGANGTSGSNGTNGLNGAVGPTGPQSPQGPGRSGRRGGSEADPSDGELHDDHRQPHEEHRDVGKVIVVRTDRIAHHKLSLKLADLRRGRYRLTLIELRPHHKPTEIGNITLTVS